MINIDGQLFDWDTAKNLNLLTVCHCYREDDTVIRIVSARKANATEAKIYGGVE